MKTLIKTLLLASLISLSSSGCAFWQASFGVTIVIPPRPALEACAELPDIRGEIASGNVIMKLEDATRLREWIHGEIVCQQTHDAQLNGHIEKLENRLKALGGKVGK